MMPISTGASWAGGSCTSWIWRGQLQLSRHCRMPVVTVLVDSVHFLHPIKVGQLVCLEAVVTRSFRTSMETNVQVFSEDPLTGRRTKTSAAFLSFVAVDDEGRPTKVPPVIAETGDEKRRYREALRRRRWRLKNLEA